ncbi:MAG: cupin domain-containing protein [Promethearchaeota archaeon]
MIKKNYKDITEEIVTKANSTNTTIRWLITKEDGSTRYATRRFEIKPGGQIGLHDHPEDHHIYVLNGTAQFIDAQNNKFEAHKDDVIYIPPNESHKIINNSSETFIFICVIPYL